ncbi:valine--tRNA ligase [Candidatus Campbellbacteria bacterium]|nr:MAG: valine--tRNA ligase [Candidatus Campbellbacteria bacterium]
MLNQKYTKAYSSKEFEDNISKIWEESGFYNPDVCVQKGVTKQDAEKFSIVLPPPNVTGKLHIGHADMLAIEDSIVRFQRMQGKKTLWLPGTDHAAIATQTKVEKLLQKEKIRKTDLGREEFLKRVNDFAIDSQSTIINQTKKLGSSLDWSRLAFTLDETRHKAVVEAFKRMYDDKIIYKDYKIVNWDPKGQTVISDDEIIYKEETTKFYYFKFGPFEIGTSRPETKLGDKYIVVHPDDKRYAEYKHGDKFKVEWITGEVEITLIKDESIDMEFGTGAMTITPSHSKVDFEIAQRHNLDKKQIIDKYGKMMENCGEFSGLKIKDAREQIVQKLTEKGLVTKVDEKYEHKIATAERSGGIIEPQIMDQWFISVTNKFKIGPNNLGLDEQKEVNLKELMMHAVKSSSIEILPERFEKVYYHWIEKLHDWAISRQIWYGHRIPVWYKNKGQENEEVFCGTEAPKEKAWVQDEDVLDTWFSSGLWTFSTLGWPEMTDDFKTYHPTDLLETGHDIIFFWVARMILMSTYLVKDIPFQTVYFHGLVRDKQNRKLSKSLGNTIDPLEMIDKYGADALRMSLLVAVAPGQDVKFDENKVRAYSKFGNKLWNIARFIYQNTEDFDYQNFDTSSLEDYQKEKIKQVENFKEELKKEYSEYKLYLVSEKLYHFVWHNLADEVIEEVKESVTAENKNLNNQYLLLYILENVLKMLHPLMPFITEEIWKDFPKENKNLLMVENWD